MGTSIFAGNLDENWRPKTAKGRKTAGGLAIRHLLRSMGCESLVKAQRQLSPPPVTTSGKRVRRKSWLRYASGQSAQLETLHNWEQQAPGIVHIVLHPIWRVLEGKRPLLLWRRHVLPNLRPHLQGMWGSMEIQRCDAPAVRRWMRETSKHSVMDALCLLTGLLLLSLDLGKCRLAISSTQFMIRALIIEHSTWPITPFVWRLFDWYQTTIWNRLPSDTFAGYDFRIACATAEPMRLLMMSNPIFAERLSIDSVLLPGRTWKDLAPAPEPDRQFFRLRYTLAGKSESLDSIGNLDRYVETWPGFVIDPRGHHLWKKQVDLEQRCAQDGLFLERVDADQGAQVEMTAGPLTVAFGGSVYFVGRLSDDEAWLESPQEHYPMRYAARRSRGTASKRATERHGFRRFPSNARVQYFGPEFRPV